MLTIHCIILFHIHNNHIAGIIVTTLGMKLMLNKVK